MEQNFRVGFPNITSSRKSKVQHLCHACILSKWKEKGRPCGLLPFLQVCLFFYPATAKSSINTPRSGYQPPMSPPALIHPELFQYILNYAHLVIEVVKAASQVSKQEAGKKCGKHSDRVGLNDEKQGEGDMRRTLLKLAWRRYLFWLQRFQTNSEMRTPSQTLILILSQAGVQVFLAPCTGAITGLLVTGLSWEGLCGGKMRSSHCGHPLLCCVAAWPRQMRV